MSETPLQSREEIQKTDESQKFRRKLSKLFKIANRTALLGILSYVAFCEPGPTVYSDIDRNDDYDHEVLREIDFLQNRYGCEIEFSKTLRTFNTKMGILSLDEKKIVLKMLREELSKYHPDYIKYFHPVISPTNYKDPVTAGVAYFDKEREMPIVVISMRYQGEDKEYLRGIIHHELAHAANYESIHRKDVNGELDPDDYADVNDEEWSKMNIGGEDEYLRNFLSIILYILGNTFNDEEYPSGYAEHYGKINEDEDKATVNEALMIDTQAIEERANYDEVVSAKTRKVKEYVYQRSGGKMDEQYWQDLALGKVNEKYWDKK